MHRDHLHPRLRRAAREGGGVLRAVVPAKPHLERHGHSHRAHHRLDQPDRMIRIPHQRRARQAAGHLFRREAHVDVDDPRAVTLGPGGGACHPVRLAPRDLDRRRGIV